MSESQNKKRRSDFDTEYTNPAETDAASKKEEEDAALKAAKEDAARKEAEDKKKAEEDARLALYCSDDYVYKISDDEYKQGDCFFSSIFGAALNHPDKELLNKIWKIINGNPQDVMFTSEKYEKFQNSHLQNTKELKKMHDDFIKQLRNFSSEEILKGEYDMKQIFDNTVNFIVNDLKKVNFDPSKYMKKKEFEKKKNAGDENLEKYDDYYNYMDINKSKFMSKNVSKSKEEIDKDWNTYIHDQVGYNIDYKSVFFDYDNFNSSYNNYLKELSDKIQPLQTWIGGFQFYGFFKPFFEKNNIFLNSVTELNTVTCMYTENNAPKINIYNPGNYHYKYLYIPMEGGKYKKGSSSSISSSSISSSSSSSKSVKPEPSFCDSDIFEKLKNKYEKVFDEPCVLYNNAKFYNSCGQTVGALVSYSCCAVLLNSLIKSNNYKDDLENLNKIMSCCLSAVKYLQEKVNTTSVSSNKNDEETKDWDKVCVKYNPLMFKKGSSDCIFFDDVAGLEKEKKIMEYSLIYPLIYPNLYPKASKGILIYGPPGTGKTYLVKAAVNYLQIKDPNVGVLFFAPSPGDLKGKFVGETEKHIEEVFTCASRAACKYESDCSKQQGIKKKYISIIFMDEMDAIGPNRDTDTTGLAVNSVNTLLQMMDGVKSFPNVSVVAATNYPWNLDGAILRRFDTQVLIDLPNESDIKKLMDIEMNRMINLDSDKSDFNYCESKKNKDINTNDQQPLICQLECENIKKQDLYTQEPYSKVEIDYYKNHKKGGLIDGIINSLKEKNFSNSDINRLLKAAATRAGELAIKANLFYSVKNLHDYRSDESKFISCLTRFKGAEGKTKAIGISRDILTKISRNESIGDLIYQVNKPKFSYLTYNEQNYWNIKCLFYKDDRIFKIDNYLIDDIYIKCDPSTNYTYEADILKDEIDIILSFKYIFKQTDANINSKLFPQSKDLINCIFNPISNIFKTIRKDLNTEDKINGPAAPVQQKISKPLTEKYTGSYQFDLENDIQYLKKDTMFEDASEAGADNMLPIFNSATKKIITSQFYKNQVQKITLKPEIKFSNLKNHNLEFLVYLSLWKMLILENKEEVEKGKEEVEEEKKESEENKEKEKGEGEVEENKKEEKGVEKGKEVQEKFIFTTYSNAIDFELSFTLFLDKKVENIDLEFKTFKKSSDNEEVTFYYYKNTDQEGYITTFQQILDLLKYYNIFNQIIDLNKYNLAANIDKYVFIPSKSFNIIFKDSLKNILVDKIELEEPDNNIFSDYQARVIQLYINDIFIFYNLKITETKQAQQQPYEQCLREYLNRLYNTANFEDFVQLACLRIYDNFRFIIKPDLKCFSNNQEAPEAPVGPEDGNPPPSPPEAQSEEADIKKRRVELEKQNEVGSRTKTTSALTHKYKYEKAVMTSKNIEEAVAYLKALLDIKNMTPDEFKTFTQDETEKTKDFTNIELAEILEIFKDVLFVFNHEAYEKVVKSAQDKNTYLIDLFNKYEKKAKPLTSKGGSLSKTLKRKLPNYKNKTVSLHTVKKTKSKKKITNKENIKYNMTGGAETTENLNNFRKFCSSENILNIQVNILQKNIYIATKFNYSELEKIPMRGGLFNDLSKGVSGIGQYLYQTAQQFAGLVTTGDIENEKKKKLEEIVQILQEKSLILPLIFKEISAIGFLTKLGDGMSTREDEYYYKEVENPENLNISWSKIDAVSRFKAVYNELFSYIPATGNTEERIDSEIMSRGANLFLNASVTGTAAFTWTLSPFVGGSWLLLILGANLRNLIWSGKTKEDIINNLILCQILSMITDIGYLETNTSFQTTTPNQIFITAMEEQFSNARSWMQYIYQKSITGTPPSFPPATVQPEVAKKYIEANEFNPEGIKNRLMNINIPIYAFYYAMTVVKSTYEPNTGNMLKLYYDNKDKFLEEYKKKLK